VRSKSLQYLLELPFHVGVLTTLDHLSASILMLLMTGEAQQQMQIYAQEYFACYTDY